MKQTKHELLMFYSYYDRTGIARHLEEMATKGWMLEKLGNWSWRYRRIEPKRLRFSVTYFPTASQFDSHPSPGQETFWDFCAAAGWELAASSAQVQIFYNENENPIPIETDPATEFTNINRSMKRSFLASYWALLAISLMQIGMKVWWALKDPIDEFISASSLIACVSYLPMLLLVAVELLRYYRWRRKARAAVEVNKALPELRSSRKLSFLVLGLAVIELLLMYFVNFSSRGMMLLLILISLYMALTFFLVHVVKNAMKHLHIKKSVNIAVTLGMLVALTIGMMAGMTALIFKMGGSGWLKDRPPAETYEYHGMTWNVYHDEIPLRIEDLMEMDYDEWSTVARQDSSFLLTRRGYDQQARLGSPNDIPDLSYEIVEIHVSFLYGLCKRDMITKYWYNHPEEYRDNYLPVDAAPWNADQVYQRHNYDGTPTNYYLLCWPDRMAEIHFYWDPTPEQIAIAAEVLKNA